MNPVNYYIIAMNCQQTIYADFIYSLIFQNYTSGSAKDIFDDISNLMCKNLSHHKKTVGDKCMYFDNILINKSTLIIRYMTGVTHSCLALAYVHGDIVFVKPIIYYNNSDTKYYSQVFVYSSRHFSNNMRLLLVECFKVDYDNDFNNSLAFSKN